MSKMMRHRNTILLFFSEILAIAKSNRMIERLHDRESYSKTACIENGKKSDIYLVLILKICKY